MHRSHWKLLSSVIWKMSNKFFFRCLATLLASFTTTLMCELLSILCLTVDSVSFGQFCSSVCDCVCHRKRRALLDKYGRTPAGVSKSLSLSLALCLNLTDLLLISHYQAFCLCFG